MRVKRSARIERQGPMTAVGKLTGRLQGAAALIKGVASRARVLPIEDLWGNREKGRRHDRGCAKRPRDEESHRVVPVSNLAQLNYPSRAAILLR
jgi:hypothetical protein